MSSGCIDACRYFCRCLRMYDKGTEMEGINMKRIVLIDILRGIANPPDCTVFGTACKPTKPIGSCMVSSEGACAAYYKYGNLLK